MTEFKGERVEVAPRRDLRDRERARAEGRPLPGRLGDPPPSLLGGPELPPGPGPGPGRRRPPARPVPGLDDDADGSDPYRAALVLRVRPGHRRDGRARVRVYHIVADRPRSDEDSRCWAFTLSRAAWERLQTERVLDSDDATYPDGSPCVPYDQDPLDVPIRCGSCGTQAVECLQIEFYEQ